MKKFISSKKAIRFLLLLLVFAISFTFNTTVFATNSTNETKSVQGVLSEYGQKYDNKNGSFEFVVDGSWSPFAGCTIKTDSFNTVTSLTISVYDSSGSCKTSQTIASTDEKANIAIFNVSPGTYTVRYSLSNASYGRIQVWIY